MVYRIFVEKRAGLDMTANNMLAELKKTPAGAKVESLRIVHRYDAENLSSELFEMAVKSVFSEPQTDIAYKELVLKENERAFAVEYLPGQFDQRADSAAQCIQIISCLERPLVNSATVYVLGGEVSDEAMEEAKKQVINPVDSREASFELPETLVQKFDLPESVETLNGFISLDDEGLTAFLKKYALAMDLDDLRFCRDYFLSEKRDPTITEIRMIDTYWSDHCRHTTFLTTIDSVKFEDEAVEKAYNEYLATREKIKRTKPINLMDIATVAVRALKAEGKLDRLDESEEINACTVKIKVNVNGEEQDWLLLFKNETHNHPTEIEPFGGAATCVGGAIRDPLSGRSYVYAAMRVTGAADPLDQNVLQGKLPQKKIVTGAAAGYSSYGNQIGLCTGIVDELYHPGYAAKRMEIGAVIAAAPAENVRRERPAPGDAVILLGGRTGRDGCGGATGSSKSHTAQSIDTCGAEVQKGNAPEERKIQRLFRNKEASLLIKRCNDFGAGGVSVAVGELADGLDINLDSVPKKYEGLDGTELAISESQERMAVVVEEKDVARFMELASKENLEATVVAHVKADPRLTMKWKGNVIVDLSREFLNSNGAEKHIDITVKKGEDFTRAPESDDFSKLYKDLAGDLNVCSKRGLSERFDSTIGAGSVLMPFGGKRQRTPIQAMVHKISVEKGDTDTCSFMSWGFDPYVSEKSPFHGAYLAVIDSVSRLIATGAEFKDVYLTFQEYFEKPNRDPARWGKPMAALLGAFKAQMELNIGSIGGKDSMSGSFEKLDVPPTLVSFAVTTGKLSDVISNDFKMPSSRVVLLTPEKDENGLPTAKSLKALYSSVTSLMREGKVLSAYAVGFGGIAEAVLKMCMGNGLGFKFNKAIPVSELFDISYGSFILELSDSSPVGVLLGETTLAPELVRGEDRIALSDLENIYENKLEPVFSCNIKTSDEKVPVYECNERSTASPVIKVARPKVLIPVFPGTNCEYDTAKAAERAGLTADIFVIKNLTAKDVAESAEEFAKRISDSQIIFIPGGFSGGDEPDGSGKFITAFFRNGLVREQTNELISNRKGLMCGICNGFQALIKLGLVPYGEIIDPDENCPTLTFNTIGRHQSRLVRTRVASVKSPWLNKLNVNDILTVPISHGEGRFIAPDELIKKLAANGQIATQYCDFDGNPTYDIDFNPNGSMDAIEGILSPDGRVLGKMGHSERIGNGLYKNVDGNFEAGLFDSAFDYFK